MTKTYAIDFESYYDNDCSITNGLENYVNHPDFDCYMVSIWGDDDFNWVGHPKDAPWELICGHTWISHNRSFDEGLWNLLSHDWVEPGVGPADWHCSADCAAYHGFPRSLKESCKEVFAVDISKGTRDNMKGLQWETMNEDFQKEVARYALDDSQYCYLLWKELSPTWPEWERELSKETTRMCWTGMPINSQKLDDSITHLHNVIAQARDGIPWHDDDRAALSPIEWANWVRSRGKLPPDTMAKDDPDTVDWAEENPEEGKVLELTWTLRGANAMIKKLQSMQRRVRPDGTLPFGMKYFGANLTGRDSGDLGFNVQNMSKGELYGVDMRSLIEARPGNTLLIADLSQIEARVIAWLAGDKELLKLAEEGVDWYEAVGRAMGLYNEEGPLKENDPNLRDTLKALSLGCQFAMGAERFASVAGLPLHEAKRLTQLYRHRNPKVVALWGKLKRGFIESSREPDKEFRLALPSGRSIPYRDVSTRNGTSAMMPRGGRMIRHKVWHGILVENATQALARDVFMDRVLALLKEDLKPILRVHDEVVFEVEESKAEESAKAIQRIMTSPPEWIPSLPLDTEVTKSPFYTK